MAEVLTHFEAAVRNDMRFGCDRAEAERLARAVLDPRGYRDRSDDDWQAEAEIRAEAGRR